MNGGHLFLEGEFPKRDRILAGLGIEDVSVRPDGATHSIYEELWHATEWQEVVLSKGEASFDASMAGSSYPGRVGPESLAEWDALVRRFLEGSRRAANAAEDAGVRAQELAPGFTYGDSLAGLAVHNAYHLGKIVALRQRLGRWRLEP